MAGKAGAVRAGRAYVELFADNSQLVRGLNMAESKLRAFGGRLRSLGSSITTAGVVGAAPIALSMKSFMEFDDAMRTVKASTNATGKQFEEMTAQARELGRSTSYTATDVANAMVELGRIFGNPELVKATAPAVLDLARATGTDLPLATAIATAAMNQFGLDASKMGMIVDVLTATCNGSAAALDSIGETLEYVGPVAEDAGLSFEETNKAIGALANMGIKGSAAGTAFRQILLQLADIDVQETLREKGVEVLDAAKNLRTDFGTLMLEIGAAMANMPNAERMTLMKKLFDQRAVSAGLKLTTKRFDDLNKAIDNHTGLARKQAAEMDAGAGGAWRELTGSIEDVVLAVGASLAPTFRKLAQYLTDCANVTSEFIEQNQGLVVGFAAVSAGLLILGPLVSGLGTVALLVASGFSILGTACTLLAAGAMSPFGLVIAGAGALLWWFGGLEAAGDTLSSHFSALGSTVNEVFGIVSDAIQAGEMKYALEALTAGVKLELLRLMDIWKSFWETLPFMGGDGRDWQRRLNEITAAENDLTRIKNRLALRIEGKRLAAARKTELSAAEVQDVLDALDPANAQGKRDSGGLSVTPRADAGWTEASIGGPNAMADAMAGGGVRTLLFDLAPEAGLVSEITRSARGTFSSLAAGRMGAATAGSRTERQFDKLLQKQDHANRRLDQFVDLALKAKLVFTGALPG